MSLQAAAQHLASRGRGPDTQLVHMAPQEVAGLQALAKAHGGTLTLNPDTGLPEAGFLKNLLPTIIGAGLAATGVGAPMAAMLVGGGYGLATGSLSKGLMAGLGAYGGAGLAGGLMSAGTGALSSAAGTTAANAVTPVAATEAVAPTLMEGASSAALTPELVSQGYGTLAPTQTAFGAFGEAPLRAADVVSQAVPTVTQAPVLTQQAADIGNIYAQEQAAQNAIAQKLASTSPFDTLKAGAGEMFKDPSRLMTKDNLRYGLAALAPAMMQEQAQQAYKDEPNPYQFAFDWERPSGPSYDSREAAQLRGRLRPITQRAEGGPVGEMSQRNEALMLMANGGQMFAEGGKTEAKQDVAKGMTGASADAFRYLMGQSAASPATQAAQNYMMSAPAPTPMNMPSADTRATTGFSGLLRRVSQMGDSSTPVYSWDPMTRRMATITPAEPVETTTALPVYGDYSGAANGGLMGLARGGVSHLGDYSDGGRLLRGPGDGVSDSIPATIADKRPARLADGEFVVPARIVSELGNGSTEAGARKLYAMMDRIQKARGKTVGKDRVAVNSRADKALPA